ncbi:unnamed protein product [Paramecium sonneborni]|uniref:Uncharacterized protein n=1 Tax=Paramecium sonneborni TaxID=65129 RepID=A0A8S1PB46_9CILI|nr:unnamed protein product [Paramecium sonneborni]
MQYQRVYIKATTRKQKNEQLDDFYEQIQYNDESQYLELDSLLQKRTQKDYLNEETKTKKALSHFEISNLQWNNTFLKSSEQEVKELTSFSIEQNFQKNQYQDSKFLKYTDIEDFSIININEINYLEQFNKPKICQMRKKQKHNISKKIYKFLS